LLCCYCHACSCCSWYCCAFAMDSGSCAMLLCSITCCCNSWALAHEHTVMLCLIH
jgi:hypothetical protein